MPALGSPRNPPYDGCRAASRFDLLDTICLSAPASGEVERLLIPGSCLETLRRVGPAGDREYTFAVIRRSAFRIT